MALILPYKGIKPKIGKRVFLAPNSTLIGDVEVGDNSSVWFNSVIRGDVNFIRIGKNTNIQDNCVIHVTHDTYPTILGDNITVGHSVVLHGCTLKGNTLVGMGSIIMDGVEVEEWVIVGAGSLIPPNKKIPSGVLVLGRPAKVVRELKEEEIKLIEESYKNYLRYKDEYLKGQR